MGELPIGVMYHCGNQPENLAPYARLVERLGYDELWLVEDCFYAGVVSAAAVAAAATQRLRIGIGIMPAGFRNPALAAMELAGLCRMFPERILPGFGHGMPDWVRQVGAEHPSPLAVLGETVSAVRSLLAGETVTVTGRHARLAEVALRFPPAVPPPVYTGVRAERSLRLSGAVADGTILAELASTEYVRWARALIDEGRREAGRTDGHRLTVYSLLDYDAARINARREMAYGLASGHRLSPADAELTEELAALLVDFPRAEALAEVLPEAYLDRFAVAGEAERCAGAVARLWQAGADAVVFVPPRDPQVAVAQITLAADELLPILRAAV